MKVNQITHASRIVVLTLIVIIGISAHSTTSSWAQWTPASMIPVPAQTSLIQVFTPPSIKLFLVGAKRDTVNTTILNQRRMNFAESDTLNALPALANFVGQLYNSID